MTEANTINMEELYHKGLEPIDFARYTSPLPTEQFEELTSLGIGAEPTHIYNGLEGYMCIGYKFWKSNG